MFALVTPMKLYVPDITMYRLLVYTLITTKI